MRSSKALGLCLLLAVLLVAFLLGRCTREADAATCIRVSAPADLQARLNQAGAGSSVCLSGTFRGMRVRPAARQTVSGGHLLGSFDLHAGYVTLRGVEVSGGDVGVHCGPHATVADSYLHDNSQNGIACAANQADWYIRITGNRIEHNGSRSLEGHSSGGVKLLGLSRPTRTLGAGATVSGNTVTRNYGNGLWLDRSSSAAIVEGNMIRDNTRHGIRCEKCGGPVLIRENVISGSGYDGIDVTSSGVVTLEGNRVSDSHDWGITVHEDWRAQKRYPALGDVTLGWHLYHVILNGNQADGVTGCWGNVARDRMRTAVRRG